jgi:hypothetical protein
MNVGSVAFDQLANVARTTAAAGFELQAAFDVGHGTDALFGALSYL